MTNEQKLIEHLKSKQLRITQARKDIYNLLSESRHSLTATEIYDQITRDNAHSSTDRVSVYRNLTLFTDLGLAHRFQDGSYTLCDHHNDAHNETHPSSCHPHKHDHVHLINHCLSCGQSSEVSTHSREICELALQLQKQSSLLENFSEIIVQGHCKQCSKKLKLAAK